MAQNPQIIDLTRSYYPGDPNAFPQNMVSTQVEDNPEKPPPILAMEGYNFLPTSYGYRSYFGLSSKLNIPALTSRVDKLLLFQDATYNNVLIALCEDGIWAVRTDVAGLAWVHEKTLSIPTVGTIKTWTYCILNNILFMYRQGEDKVYKVEASPLYNATNPYPIIGITTITKTITGIGVTTPYLVSIATLSSTTYGSSAGGIASVNVQEPLQQLIANDDTLSIAFTWADSPAIRVNNGAGLYAVWFRVYFQHPTTLVVKYKDIRVAVDNVLPNNSLALTGVTLTGSSTFTNFPDASSVNTQVSGLVSEFTPSFLTMTGQLGIFRVGGRLGMWDSSNSVSYSSAEDFTNFTPNIISGAGNNSFLDVKGNIVLCLANAGGFIVYCTATIFAATETFNDTNIWDVDVLTTKSGVVSARQVTTGITDDDHYVWTNNSIAHIGNYNALSRKHSLELMAIDTADFLKETNIPIHLSCMNGRYLFLEQMDDTYINGLISWSAYTIPPRNVLLINGIPWDGQLESLPPDISGYHWGLVLEQLLTGNTSSIIPLIESSSVYTGNPNDVYTTSWTMYDESDAVIGIY